MNKVLFITYYWPPSGKASLHWPLKMIKYLPEFGWQPIVLTVNEDTFSANDNSLIKEVPDNLEVIKTRTFEPFDIYKKFTGKKKDDQLIASETISTTNKKLSHRISIWIRMNLFIPDARIGWYFFARRAGRKLLKTKGINAIISIGPPQTTHLIANNLSKKFNIPHIPVFIDPWVDIIYYRNFRRSKITLAIDNYLEKKVLYNSTYSIFVTETMKNDYIKKYSFLKDKSRVLYWGYNEEDFEGLPSAIKNEEIIVHAGNIFDFQNIPALWENIKKENDKGRNLKLKFIGTVGPAIIKSIEAAGISKFTEYAGFLPYKEMLRELNNASYLLVCATEPRHVPGKLFEYLRIGKPIIAFGNDNDEVKHILSETHSGMIFRYDDNKSDFFNKEKNYARNLDSIKLFDRKSIAFSLSKILDSIVK